MLNWFFRHLSFGRQKKEGFKNAFTLVELLITMAILGTLGAIAVPKYKDYIAESSNDRAKIAITDISSQIEGWKALNGSYPATLAVGNIVPPLDPWGNSYQYVKLEGLTKAQQDAKSRWDKLNKPLNYDYDLYSMGKDGQTSPKLTDKQSLDDIVRCNGGAYVGLGSGY